MSLDFSELLVGKNDKVDQVEILVSDESLLNKEVKEVTLFYNIVGEGRFKMFRNNKMELIFVHVTDDWMRQAKINIGDYSGQLNIKATWDNEQDTLSVKAEDGTHQEVTAIQIDN
ncbi:hypothetical protein [Desulfofalx alkaliphila]|uniref:hypothetical protein n=1 Tax=Desulfofalx alkaliphila TaxID=105483 RepID=UPI0004E225F2|nr:hypothetical protein [Desulfofalx alkaliphila]